MKVKGFELNIGSGMYSEAWPIMNRKEFLELLKIQSTSSTGLKIPEHSCEWYDDKTGIAKFVFKQPMNAIELMTILSGDVTKIHPDIKFIEHLTN